MTAAQCYLLTKLIYQILASPEMKPTPKTEFQADGEFRMRVQDAFINCDSGLLLWLTG